MTNLFTNLSNWKLKYVCALVVLLYIGSGSAWGDPTVLFHETFGNNSSSARAWDNTYRTQSGVSAVYSGATSYTVSNAKQSKNTMGYGTSTEKGNTAGSAILSNQGSQGTVIIGPLNVSSYTSLALTHWFGKSSAAADTWNESRASNPDVMKVSYSTNNSTWNILTRSGSNPNSGAVINTATNHNYVLASYTLPAAAQVSTLYLKFEFYCYKLNNSSQQIGQVYIDEVELTGTAASCSATPSVGAASLNGSFSLSSVGVQCASASAGTGCSLSEYGFVWGTSNTGTHPDATDNKVTNAGAYAANYTNSLTPILPATEFSTGTTYYYRGYAKNNGDIYGYSATVQSFTPYKVYYNKNNGSATGSITDQIVNTGGSVTLSDGTGFTLAHYHVDHWAKGSAEGTSYAKEATYSSITANAEFYAIWAINSWTFAWDFDGGSSSETAGTHYTAAATLDYGTSITKPSNGSMSKTGYTFDSWNSNATSMPDENLTIKAIWTADEYDITYKDQGNVTYSGSNSASLPAKHTYGSATALVDGAKTGYTFGGWYTDADCTESAGSSIGATAITDGITLYAKWTPKNYTVTLNDGSGSGGSGTKSVTFNSNTNLTSNVAVPTYTGYDFRGYYTSTGGSGTKVIDGTGAWIKGTSYVDASGNWIYDGGPTLHAYWTAYEYENYRAQCGSVHEITLDDGLAATTNNGSANVLEGATSIYSIDPPTKNGYDIEGYYTTSGLNTKIATSAGALSASVTVSSDDWTDEDSKWVYDGDATFYTKWQAHAYDLTYEDLEGASNTNPDTYTIETATIVLADPGSRTGYTFTGWTCGGDAITQIAQGTTGDKTITANWTINHHTVAVSAADHVVITATPAGGSAIVENGSNTNVDYNKTITLGCTPDDHWNLAWDVYKTGESSTKVAVTGSGDGATFTMPDYNVTVTAVMTEDTYHTATFKNNGIAIDGYDEVKTYDGTRPSAPTLTDVTDACDKTECTLFYGWIAEAGIWDETLDDISDKTIYRNASDLPNVSGADVTYHAVWAKGTSAPTINTTLIAKWDKQSFSASTAVKAKDKDGNTLDDVTLTPNIAMSTDGVYAKAKASLGEYPLITIAGLDFSSYDGGVITFFARGSQEASVTVEYSTNNGSTYSSDYFSKGSEKKEHGYIVEVPKNTTNIQISYGSNTGNFYFGTVKAYGKKTTSYNFTALTSSNTSGWSGADWDGYYLITATKDTKTYALRSDVMDGLYGYSEVSPSESVISTSDIGLMYKVTYNSSTTGYAIKSVATQDYLTDNGGGFSQPYHLLETSATEAVGMAYNQITHATSYYVQWSNDRFGSYSSSTSPTLYKILSSYTKWRINCCEKNDITKDGDPAGTVTGGTFTVDKTSACEGATVTMSVTSTSSGYNFDEWEVTGDDSSDEITVTDNTFEMPDEAVTVTAKFKTAHTTTVTLNAQGGSSGTSSVTATVNLAMPDATMPTKTGYEFGGYYLATNGSGTQYYDADGNSAHDWDNGEDATEVLYAKWVASGYTVTLNKEGATTQGTASVSVTYGANTNLTSAITCPTYTGNVFGGYWTTASGEGTQLIDGDGNWIPNVTSYTGSNKQWLYANDIELHARWSNVSYTNYRTTCGPEIEVTVSGTVRLTAYAGCEVLTPSTSLITVSSDDWKSIEDEETYLNFRFKDKVSGVTYTHTSSSTSGTTQKIANSEFRIYNAADNGGSYADGGYIKIPGGTTSATYSFRVAYTPTSGVYNTNDHYVLEVEAMMDNSGTKKTITLELLDLYGRTLPQEFVVAVKKDGNWYALPNNLPSTAAASKATAAIPIVVDNATTPSCAMYAPENVLYKATGYYTAPAVASRNRSGIRFTRNGSQYLQVSTTAGTNTMWLSTTGGADVQDWYLNSSNFQSYELKMDPRAGTGGYKDKKMGMLGSNFGFYSSPTAYDIYLLPVENTLEEASAVEWGKNSLVLDVDAGSYSHVIARVGSTATGALSFSQTRTSSKGSASANTYTINVGNTINFDEKADQLLYLDWLNGSGSVVGVSMVTIPWIINGTKTMSVVDATKGHWANAEVHVLPGATLTADAGTFSNVTIKQLEIYPGATVQVTTGELTTTNLMLRNGWSRAGEKRYDAARLYITPSTGTLKATNVFADWYIDYDQYYPVSVPWKVTTSGITYLNTSNAASGGVKLRYYDGNSRATNVQAGVGEGVNWKEYSPWPETMNPGKGYAMTARRPTGKAFSVVRLPLTLPSGAWTSGTWTTSGEAGTIGDAPSDIHKDTVYVHAWGVDNDSKPRYAVGWNFIAQPYMSIYQGPITHSEGEDYDVEVVNIPDIQFKEYDQYAVGTLGQKLLPAGGFFIQTEKDGTLTFGTTNRKASAPSYRKETQNLTNKQKAYIVLNDEEHEDMMGLLISDHYTVNYDINGDFEKLMSDGTSLKTYMRYNEMNMAYVAINEELAREWIPVTVRIPENGEYTYSLHEASIAGDLEGVYLIDYQNGDLITNLMDNNYTFYSPAGTISGRFAINAIVGKHNTPTSIDIINAGGDIHSDKPVKFLFRDKVFILHQGVIYDSTGKKVSGK